MSELVKIQKTNGQPCCEEGLIPYVTDFTFDAEGTNAVVTEVETTKYLGSFNYARVYGTDLTSVDKTINGTIRPEIQCLPYCNFNSIPYSSRGGNLHSYGLRVIQVGGQAGVAAYGESINGSNMGIGGVFRSVSLAIGETVTFQTFGGIGHRRFARSTSPAVASVGPRVSVEADTYEPIMELMGPKQMGEGRFTTDKGFNLGSHLFTVTAQKLGKCLIKISDEGGCEWTLAFHVFGSLCDGSSPNNPFPVGNLNPASGPDKDLSGDGGHKNIKRTNKLLDCAFEEDGDATCIPWHFGGNDLFFPNLMYDIFGSSNSCINTTLYRSTRYTDKNGQGVIRSVISMPLEESRTIDIPDINGASNWTVEYLKGVNKGGLKGQGYDNNTGPMWGNGGGQLVDAQIVGDLQVEFKCNKAATNYLPDFFLVYPKSPKDHGLGPHVPQQTLTIEGGGGLASFTAFDGTVTSLGVSSGPTQARITTLPFIVAVHCTCPDFDLAANLDAGNFGPGNKLTKPLDAGIPLTKFKKRAYDTDTVSEANINGNVIDSSHTFTNNYGIAGSTTAFGTAVLFCTYGAAGMNASNEIPFMENGVIPDRFDFWDTMDHNSMGNKTEFINAGNSPWQGFEKSFLVDQPRGSACTKGAFVPYESNAEMVVIESSHVFFNRPMILKGGGQIVAANSTFANAFPFRWNI